MKTLRLMNNERTAIREKWKENPVFAAFYEYCKERCRTMNKLEYQPEEVFYAVFVVLDNIKERDDRCDDYIAGLGNRLRNLISDGYDVPENQLWLAVCEILSIAVIVVLFWRNNPLMSYHKSVMCLLNEIDPTGAKGMKRQAEMMNSVPKEKIERVKTFAIEYMNSEERISDDIAKMLNDEETIDMLSENVEKNAQWLENTNEILNLRITLNGVELSRSLDWIYTFIKENFVQRVSRSYEWYALYRFLNDKGYLQKKEINQFASLMNEWYKDTKFSCSRSEVGRYSFLTGYSVSEWDTIKKESIEEKKKVSLNGIRRIQTLYKELVQKHDCPV